MRPLDILPYCQTHLLLTENVTKQKWVPALPLPLSMCCQSCFALLNHRVCPARASTSIKTPCQDLSNPTANGRPNMKPQQGKMFIDAVTLCVTCCSNSMQSDTAIFAAGISSECTSSLTSELRHVRADVHTCQLPLGLHWQQLPLHVALLIALPCM